MNEPTHDPHILELLEVCRPDQAEQDDPLRAELAAAIKDSPQLEQLWQRIRQIDVRLSAALHDVSPSDGLARRILERLAAMQAAAAIPASGEKAIGGEPAAPDRSVDRRGGGGVGCGWGRLFSVGGLFFVCVWVCSLGGVGGLGRAGV